MKRPVSVGEARGAPGEFRAGGTDVQARRRLGLSAGELVDLRYVEGLAGIVHDGEQLRIGALTRITTVATAEDVVARFPALSKAAGSLATPQIRAVGTLGGNLLQRNRCPYFRHPDFDCHKSGGDTCPAREGEHRHGVIFDLGPCVSPHPSTLAMALLLYDARIETSGGSMTVSELMGDGSDGSRDHHLPGGEVLVAVALPSGEDGEQGAYHRVTGRALAEWPIVEAACRLRVEEGRIVLARLAVGGVAPVPLRIEAVEEGLTGLGVDDLERQRSVSRLATDGASPLPATGHKQALLQNAVFAVTRSALDGVAGSETAIGEAPLQARVGPG